MSSADSLMRRGAEVLIVEKESFPGQGAAKYNSGMIHPSQSMPWMGDQSLESAKKLFKLANYSLPLLQERRAALGCNDLSRPQSTLQLFDNVNDRDRYLAQYQKIGITAVYDEGDWSFGRPALRFQGDESGNAYDYMQRLTLDLARRGCVFVTGKAAKLTIVNKKVIGVKLSTSEDIIADQVVVAAGTQSREVLADLNKDFPLVPLRGHALLFEKPSSVKWPAIPVMHAPSRSALTVFEDHIRLSGTVNEDRPDALLNIWRGIAPRMMDELGELRLKWSADRPMSLLGRPIMGLSEVRGLWINTGHGHMGWSLCSASGEIIADMIIGGKSYPDFALP